MMENTSIHEYVNYDYARRLDKISKSNGEDIIMDDVFSMQFDNTLRLIGYIVQRINSSTILIRKKDLT